MLRQLTIVIVRLFGISIIISALTNLPYWLALAQTSDEVVYSTILPLLAYAVAGLLMFLFAESLARLIQASGNQQELNVESPQLVEAGTFLIGLYWIATSLPNAVIQTTLVIEGLDNTFLLFDSLSRIVIGILLVLGLKTIVKFFKWARIAGSK